MMNRRHWLDSSCLEGLGRETKTDTRPTFPRAEHPPQVLMTDNLRKLLGTLYIPLPSLLVIWQNIDYSLWMSHDLTFV